MRRSTFKLTYNTVNSESFISHISLHSFDVISTSKIKKRVGTLCLWTTRTGTLEKLFPGSDITHMAKWVIRSNRQFLCSLIVCVSVFVFTVASESSDGSHIWFLLGNQRPFASSHWGCKKWEWERSEGIRPGFPRACQQAGGGKSREAQD